MLTRSRWGFTLVEVMVSLTLTLVVAGALYSLLVSTQRITRAQAQRVELQSNVRAGSLVVLNELRELSAVAGGTGAQNDILVAGATALVFRAMRGIGFICGTPSATTIRMTRRNFTGSRDPQAVRDQALIFIEDSAAAGAEDSPSFTVRLISIATVCPAFTTSPPRGNWNRTVSAFPWLGRVARTRKFKPAFPKTCSASNRSFPTTSGTITSGLRRDK